MDSDGDLFRVEKRVHVANHMIVCYKKKKKIIYKCILIIV